MSQLSKPANVLSGPVADTNLTFAIHSQPVSLLEKHAHAAFTTALIPPNAFQTIGRVDQFTLIPPNIAALMPRMLGGVLDDNTFDFDEETAAFIAAVNQRTRKKPAIDRSLFGSGGGSNSPVGSSRARDGFEYSDGAPGDYIVSRGPQGNLAQSSTLADETGSSRPRPGFESSTNAPADYVSGSMRGNLAPGGVLIGGESGSSRPRPGLERSTNAPADYVSGGGHGNLAFGRVLTGEEVGSSHARTGFEYTPGASADYVSGGPRGNLARSSALTDGDDVATLATRLGELDIARFEASNLQIQVEAINRAVLDAGAAADASRQAYEDALEASYHDNDSDPAVVERSILDLLAKNRALGRKAVSAASMRSSVAAQAVVAAGRFDALRAAYAAAQLRMSGRPGLGLGENRSGADAPRMRKGDALETLQNDITSDASRSGPRVTPPKFDPHSPSYYAKGDGSAGGGSSPHVSRPSPRAPGSSSSAYDPYHGGMAADPTASEFSRRRPEKAMQEAINLSGSQATSNSVLEAAHAKYPLILRAMRRRFAPTCPSDTMYHQSLPVSTVSQLAASQAHQNAGLRICHNSVKKEQPIGGPKGKTCLDIFASSARFDLEASRYMANPDFPVDLHVAEVVGGALPLVALAMCLLRSFHAPAKVMDGLVKAAHGVNLIKDGKLAINEGCSQYFEHFAIAMQLDRFPQVENVYRTLGARIATAADIPFVTEERSWSRETHKWLAELATRETVSNGGPTVTVDELINLTELLRFFGRCVEDSDAAVAANKDVAGEFRVNVGRSSVEEDKACLDYLLAEAHKNPKVKASYLRAQKKALARPPPIPPPNPCWNRECSKRVHPAWIMCYDCHALNPDLVHCGDAKCIGGPFLPGGKCSGCSKTHTQAFVVAKYPTLQTGVLAIALSQRPHLTALKKPEATTPRSAEEPQVSKSAGAKAVASPRARVGTIGSTLRAEVKVMAESQDLLSAWAGEKNGWTWLFNSIKSGASIPGVGFVELRRDGTGDAFLDLVPHRTSTPDNPVWTPWLPGWTPEHVSLTPRAILVDNAAQTSIMSASTAADMIADRTLDRTSIIGVGNSRAQTLGRGVLTIVVDVQPGGYNTEAHLAAIYGTITRTPTDDNNLGNIVDAMPTAAARRHQIEHDPHAPLRVMRGALHTRTSAAGEWGTAAVARAEQQPDRRAACDAMIRDAKTLATRMTITDSKTLSMYHTMADGVAEFPHVELPEAHLRLKAFGRRPRAYNRLNQVSHAVREYLEPGQSFWTDVSNVREADADGNKYARLGVCGVTGFGLLTFNARKDTQSLVEHLTAIEEMAISRTGRTPLVYRMDFASEAASQGRGDNPLNAGVRAFLATRPGIRVVPLAPHTQAHNKSENAWGILLGICLQNHIRSCVSPLGWRMIMDGSLFQYNRHPIATAGNKGARLITKLEAFSGKSWDASTMLGFPGQGCWVHRYGARKNLGEPLVEAGLYICPSENATGQLVLLLRNFHRVVVASATMLEDTALRPAALELTALHEPQGRYAVPSGDTYGIQLQQLFAAYPDDPDFATVEHNVFSGYPTRIIPMNVWEDEDGVIHVTARDPQGVEADVEVPHKDDEGLKDTYVIVAHETTAKGSKTLPAGFLSHLPSSTRIRFDQEAKTHTDGSITKSRARYLAYREATTIGEYRALHPLSLLATPDLSFDLAHGHAMVHADDLPARALRTETRNPMYIDAPFESESANGGGVLPTQFARRLAGSTRLHIGPAIWPRSGGTRDAFISMHGITSKAAFIKGHPGGRRKAMTDLDLGLATGRISIHMSDPLPTTGRQRIRRLGEACASHTPPTPAATAVHTIRYDASTDDLDITPVTAEPSPRSVPDDPWESAVGVPAFRSAALRPDRKANAEVVMPPGPDINVEGTNKLINDLDAAIRHARDMEHLERPPPAREDDDTEELIRGVIGDERRYTDHYLRNAAALRAGIHEDNGLDSTFDGYTHVIHPDVAMQSDTGVTIPKSVGNAMSRPDYEGEFGWRASLQKEFKRVEGFNAWELVSGEHMRTARREYPGRVSIGHIVIAFRNKIDPEGNPLEPGVVKKSRCAYADSQDGVPVTDSFSACVDDVTDRVITAVGERLGAKFDTKDVSAAYFNGEPLTMEQGGRAVYAEVPKYLSQFGDYPTHDEHGRKNYLRIWGNMPGLREAGSIWQRRYDTFLKKIGMRQSVVDRRLFALKSDKGILMAHIHVDDTRLTFTSDAMRDWFVNVWTAEFKEKPGDVPLSEDFIGIRRTTIAPGTTAMSCLGIIKSLAELIKPYPLPHGVICTWPMSANAPRELREGPTEKNQLVPDLVPLARQLCGTIGFITSHVRPDAYFAFVVCARYMSEERLTRRGFAHLLRLSHYLVATADLPLVIHSEPPESKSPTAWAKEGLFDTYVDSSHGNAYEGRSYGGFVIMHKGGGALAWKCKAQEIATDSSGAQELTMATIAYKYTLAMRMLLYDLALGSDCMDPTPFFTDSQIILDGTDCERFAKTSRWLAARYAMIRYGKASGAILPLKIDGKENVADIVTKALVGAVFEKHRATILGHANWTRESKI